MTYGQRYEESNLFKPKDTENKRAEHLFASLGSHGANPKKLAQLLAIWDFTMSMLDWKVDLNQIITGYQASIDTHYHNDYKAVATIEELDRRMATRRSAKSQGLISNNDT